MWGWQGRGKSPSMQGFNSVHVAFADTGQWWQCWRNGWTQPQSDFSTLNSMVLFQALLCFPPCVTFRCRFFPSCLSNKFYWQGNTWICYNFTLKRTQNLFTQYQLILSEFSHKCNVRERWRSNNSLHQRIITLDALEWTANNMHWHLPHPALQKVIPEVRENTTAWTLLRYIIVSSENDAKLKIIK